MTAAIYARKSTDQPGLSEDQKSDSIERQIEHARAFAVKKGWTIADEHVFADDGISGAEFSRRPKYLQLLNALKPRAAFQILIVSEVARLGREQLETGYTLKQLSQAGVRVFSYLEDREILMETPTEKFLMSAVNFAHEIEREKARQRTYDAMLRKARAGHVTGGRVFGYDNIEKTWMSGKRSHVERQINEHEAGTVRRIFQLCAEGYGKTAIANRLNAERAPTPNPGKGRPRGWSASSVREVLFRELYRGVVVWNQTRKRDNWGQVKASARTEAEWLRVDKPELEIVDRELWHRAHARLTESRRLYLRSTSGQLYGRPLDGAARKHLLTGLARCGKCRGPLEVNTRRHGRHRVFFYVCARHRRPLTKWPKWASEADRADRCPGIDVPLERANQFVLDLIADRLFDPARLERVTQRLVDYFAGQDQRPAARHAALERRRNVLDSEIFNLAEAIAHGADLDAFQTAIQTRRLEHEEIKRELAELDKRAETVVTESVVRRVMDQFMTNFRAELSTDKARQVVQKVVTDRITFEPETRDEQPGYRVRVPGTLGRVAIMALSSAGVNVNEAAVAQAVDSRPNETSGNPAENRDGVQGGSSPTGFLELRTVLELALTEELVAWFPRAA